MCVQPVAARVTETPCLDLSNQVGGQTNRVRRRSVVVNADLSTAIVMPSGRERRDQRLDAQGREIRLRRGPAGAGEERSHSSITR